MGWTFCNSQAVPRSVDSTLVKIWTWLAIVDVFGSSKVIQGIEHALKVLDGMENNGSHTTAVKLIQPKNGGRIARIDPVSAGVG